MKYKNILFDFGGVFLDIDYQKTRQAFIDLGITNFDDLYAQDHVNELFGQLERGEVEPATFYNELRRITNTTVSNAAITQAWCAMLGTFELKKLDWLREIGQRYRVFLFSNTNLIHYEKFMAIYHQQTGRDDFNAYFEHAFYSHQIGVRKPLASAYHKVLGMYHLAPEETVFIDDTYKNIVGAEEAGLHTIFLAAPMTVFDLDL
jgi:FMN phosphatase YigB (HAD superfamily)